MQITNQAVIYELAPEARSRINSAYMFCYSWAAPSGRWLQGLCSPPGGGTGCAGSGAAFGVLTLLMAGVDRLRPAGGRRTLPARAS